MEQIIQTRRTPFAWWKSIGLAVTAVYAPFVAMAIYTQIYIQCPHCKKATLEILPIAPGMALSWLIETRLFHGLPQSAFLAICILVDLLLIAGLSGIIRLGGAWRVVGITLVLALSIWFALGTLGLIRA